MSLRDLMDKCPSFAHLRQGPLWGVSLSISGDSWQREQYLQKLTGVEGRSQTSSLAVVRAREAQGLLRTLCSCERVLGSHIESQAGQGHALICPLDL